MSDRYEYRNRKVVLAARINNLLCDLGPSTYDEIAPGIEYWIEYALAEQLMTVNDLVEQVSSVAWDNRGSYLDISRFLKEFREAPHRPEQARSFVDELCLHVLRWFAVASANDFGVGRLPISNGGGPGFIRAASFVGHLIKRGFFGRELVRRHLKSLMTNHYNNNAGAIRANAIYELFTAADNTLLQGLLEPEDVQVCFERLETRISLGNISGLITFSTEGLNVRCGFCFDICHQNLTYGLGTS